MYPDTYIKSFIKEKVEMMATKNAPTCGNRVGAFRQDNLSKHPVPIVSHPKPLRKRNRIKLVWTPLNFSLLLLAVALVIYFVVEAVTASPLEFEMISKANSVLNV